MKKENELSAKKFIKIKKTRERRDSNPHKQF